MLMLVITNGSATRQYGEGGFPSKMNWSRAVTRSADTMINPCGNLRQAGRNNIVKRSMVKEPLQKIQHDILFKVAQN